MHQRKLVKPHYLIINADESEPGTCKDRDILRFEPQKLLEGCLLALMQLVLINAIFILEENIQMKEKLQDAINEAYEKLIGKNFCNSGWDLDIYIHYGPERTYVGKKQHFLKV